MNRVLHTLLLASLAINHGASEEKYDSKSLNRLGNERQYEKLPKFSKVIGGLKRQIGTQIKDNPFQEPWEPANQIPASASQLVEPDTNEVVDSDKHDPPVADSDSEATQAQKTKGPFWGDYPNDADPLKTRKQERRDAGTSEEPLEVKLLGPSVEQENNKDEHKASEEAKSDLVVEAMEGKTEPVVEAMEGKTEDAPDKVTVDTKDIPEPEADSTEDTPEPEAGSTEDQTEPIAEADSTEDQTKPVAEVEQTQRPTRKSLPKEKASCEVRSRILNFVRRPEAELQNSASIKRNRRESTTQNTSRTGLLQRDAAQVLNVSLHQNGTKLHIIPPANPVHIPNFPRYYEMQNKIDDQAELEKTRRFVRKEESESTPLDEVTKYISYP